MDLEGRFTSPEALADIMRRAAEESFSGELSVRCGVNSASHFWFYQGKLSSSANPDRSRRLGRLLLNRGLVDRATLEDTLAYQADFARTTPIGRLLVQRGHVQANDLQEVVRIQVEDDLSQALTCIEGFYIFTPVENGEQPGEPPLVQIPVSSAIDDVLSRHSQWGRIREKVKDDNMIPVVVKLGGSNEREALHLSTRDWHILSLVNGYYDVGCISARSGLGRFDTFKALEHLITSGVVVLQQPKLPPAEAYSADGNSATNTADAASKSAGSSSSRWGSLLARLRDDAESPAAEKDPARRLQFESPVGFMTEVCNAITEKLLLNADFVIDPSDEKLAERHWRQILMTFPRADLVSAEMNRLDCSSFDRYTRTLGVSGPMETIYLDTIEALTRYLRTLYLVSAQRLGTRAARSLFVDIMEDIRGRATIANSSNFFFKEVAAEILA